MKKMYVVIDKHLEPSYRAVQGAHAVAEYLIQNKNTPFSWQNETLVFVQSIDIVIDYDVLVDMELDLYPFYEPDLNNRLTAFACYSDRAVFNRFRMN